MPRPLIEKTDLVAKATKPVQFNLLQITMAWPSRADRRLGVGLRCGSFFCGRSRSGFFGWRSWCSFFGRGSFVVCRSSGATASRSRSTARRCRCTAGDRCRSTANRCATTGGSTAIIVVVATIVVIILNAAATTTAATAEEQKTGFRFLGLCAEPGQHQHHSAQCEQTEKLTTHLASPLCDV